MTQTERIRPSLWHCLWGVPFFLIGGGLFFFALIQGITHATDSLTQIVVPGRAELGLQSGQTYTVFLERQSSVNGKIYSTTQPVEGLECRVTALSNGAGIAINRPSGTSSYEVNGRSGRSFLTFSIKQDGKYAFACDYGGNGKGPELVVAVGSGVDEAIIRTIASSLVAMFGGGGLGVLAILAVVIKRERDKKRIRQSGQIPI